MTSIVLPDDEPIKFFSLLTPDKVEASYGEISTGIYIDTPGQCVAMVDFKGGTPAVSVELL